MQETFWIFFTHFLKFLNVLPLLKLNRNVWCLKNSSELYSSSIQQKMPLFVQKIPFHWKPKIWRSWAGLFSKLQNLAPGRLRKPPALEHLKPNRTKWSAGGRHRVCPSLSSQEGLALWGALKMLIPLRDSHWPLNSWEKRWRKSKPSWQDYRRLEMKG